MPDSKAEDPTAELRQKGWRGKILIYLKSLGPGLITGASDDDFSGIGTYSQTGAQFGDTQLWTAIFTLPLMIAVQEMCARIALKPAAAWRTSFGSRPAAARCLNPPTGSASGGAERDGDLFECAVTGRGMTTSTTSFQYRNTHSHITE